MSGLLHDGLSGPAAAGAPEGLFRAPVQVIYDADCAFCRRSVSLLRRIDVNHRLGFHASRDWDRVQDLIPGLTVAQANTALYATDGPGRSFRGFYAVRRVLWTSPFTRALLPLFYMPGASLVGPPIYGWIAKHRHDFGCNSDGCTLPHPAPTPEAPP